MMRLVLREYLSMLKESGELDALLPDLLVSMGLDPLSRPSRGTRQYGVDLPAVGVDPEDGQRKLFLFLVKQGDISRSSWDTGEQAVRPSLNEVFDIYLRTQVRPEHKDLPKKIVLATSGELKQNVEPNWTGYAREHSGTHPNHGEIQIEFWGADRLALLLEKYLVDEYLFPEAAQKQIRKTIALADQNEDDPRHFYALVEETLFKRDLPTDNSAGSQRKRQHALRLLNLSLNIVFHWCREADNLRPALLCAEQTLLRTWDWIRQNGLFDDPVQEEFARLFNTYLTVARSFANKIQAHCFVRDGLFGYGADELDYPLRTFEVIGILGELGVGLAFLAASTEDEDRRTSFLREGQAVVQMLAALIENNPSAFNPLFDGHTIDIGMGLLALTVVGAKEQAASWLEQLGRHVIIAYQLDQRFPISTDSFDDLVSMRFDEGPSPKELKQLSTLVPLLADWFAVFELQNLYGGFRAAVAEVLPETNLQMWFPDEGTEEVLYRENAGVLGGKVLGSIELPERLDSLKERIARLQEQSVFAGLSCVEQGWPVLGLIASRHFRTPLIPDYWHRLVSPPAEPSQAAEASLEGAGVNRDMNSPSNQLLSDGAASAGDDQVPTDSSRT